jgi:hypothetical protein
VTRNRFQNIWQATWLVVVTVLAVITTYYSVLLVDDTGNILRGSLALLSWAMWVLMVAGLVRTWRRRKD